MRQIGIYILFCLLLSKKSFAAVSEEGIVRFEEFLGPSVKWSATLQGARKSCRIEFKVGTKPSTVFLEARDCTKVMALADDAKKASQQASASPKNQTSSGIYDQPSYRVTINGKTSKIKLEAPEVCELKDGEEINCEYNDLSAAQLLLIEFRKRLPKK